MALTATYVDTDRLDYMISRWSITVAEADRQNIIDNAENWISLIIQKHRHNIKTNILSYYATQKAVALLGSGHLGSRIQPDQAPPGLQMAIEDCKFIEKATPDVFAAGITSIPITKG